MNRIPYFGQKNDVAATYIFITGDFESELPLKFNDAVSCFGQLAVSSDTIQYNATFTHALNFGFYLLSESSNSSSVLLLNGATSNDSINKTSSDDEIGNNSRDCSSRFDNKLLTHFIGFTNL